MIRMLELLGHPEQSMALIHVAGTNGKGSVCAFAERALRENGYKTGLFTSPYLRKYQERIRINGIEVDDALFVREGEKLYKVWMTLNDEGVFPTAFELGAALAFLCFEASGVQIAVIEVGIGGRLDPTNVIAPICCAIASIAFDHEHILGHSIGEIAREKAGIIKENTPIALSKQSDEAYQVISKIAKDRHAELLYTKDLPLTSLSRDAHGARFDTEIEGFGAMHIEIALPGAHQVKNALLALSALSLAQKQGIALDADKVCAGLRAARWAGRLDWATGNLLLDGAHNAEGASALADYVQAYLGGRRIVLLTAMMREKHPDECAKIFGRFANHVVTTQVNWPRALPADELCALYQNIGIPAIAEPDVAKAYAAARRLAGKDAVLIVCGSLYLVGDIYNFNSQSK